MSNLEYLGLDHHWPAIPRFAKSPNDWYFACQQLVRSSICLYSSLLGSNDTDTVLNGYYRSHADEDTAEQFFMRYDVEPFDIIKDNYYSQAFDTVTEWFRPSAPIHPVHFTDVRWYPWKISTSAERPFTHDPLLKKKVQLSKQLGLLDNARMSFHNCYNDIFTYCRHYTHEVKDARPVTLHHIDLHVKPALVRSGEPPKIRTVFGVPKSLIFAEAMFFWPLFSDYFTNSETPLLWNYETLNGGWYRLNDEFYQQWQSFCTIFNLDWSEFDMRVYFSMLDDCRDAVKSYFCFCGNYCPTRTYPTCRTNPQRLQNLWNWIGTAYKDTPCTTTTGKVYRRRFAGMPSGIFCTQFWDSFYNCIMVVTTLEALGFRITDRYFLKVLGDDVIFGILKHIPISKWADFLQDFSTEARRRFNSKLNSKKCGASSGIHGAQVLSYINWNGYPKRDSNQLLAQLLHPKSLRDTYPRLMARAIGIYYASCGDPKIRPICNHIYSELKYAGFTPSSTGLHGLFDPNASIGFIELDHFPSENEVTCRLHRKSKRSAELQALYWPRDHFLEEAGSSRNCPLSFQVETI
ncbi:RNA-dependent RNA polymerase [Raphanus sativus cryptic virus 1]|uniref:RNA-dependent RNA polymerase n=1 Tax=Raphanus sativus cryptic virus 1 TaxID=348449 RepID=UPI00005AA2EB|nr:RNA-dependent RNA polymerase [Raphanus sativus cryptic virus 1]AAX51289.2 RNA-dependent RNA polymerase [Raphanus sativus cryptic virus 1]